MNIQTVLDDAIALVEQGWQQGTDARDKKERAVPLCTEEAHSFCMMGAVHRAIVGARDPLEKLSEDERDLYFGARGRIQKAMNTREHPVLWNDARGRTQDEVLAVMRRAREAT